MNKLHLPQHLRKLFNELVELSEKERELSKQCGFNPMFQDEETLLFSALMDKIYYVKRSIENLESLASYMEDIRTHNELNI